MPAVNPNKGSTPALVIFLIGFVILSIAAVFYAIYCNAQWTKAQLETDQAKANLAKYVNEIDLSNPDFEGYVKVAKKPQAAMNVVMAEREQLSKVISGAAAPNAQVSQDALRALGYATETLKGKQITGVTIPGDLDGAIRNLTDALVTMDGERAKAVADAAAANDAAKKTTDERDAMLKAKDDAIAAVTADKDKAVAENEEYQKTKGADITQIQTDATAKITDLQAAAEKLQAELNKKDAEAKAHLKLIAALEDRMRATRVNTNEPVVQQADGKLLRIPSQDTVFIDIGQQQQVTLGLTFEVYDHHTGIPALGNGMRDTDLPVGKASIEVIHVLPTSSECRVIHRELGATLTEGDLIMNLIYDPNTHYKFMVYGNFDMSNEGAPTPADADVIKRLITQWGGRLVSAVDVSTDFVVLGAEPVVPILTKDDENDPVKTQKRDAQQAALDAFLDVESKAIQLGIPIMNQNRFLYFIGYYDQANR